MEEDEPEAERSIPPWVELEYAHMRIQAGEGAHVHFTHLSKSSGDALTAAFQSSKGLADTSCHKIGVLELMKSKAIDISKVCLLDPKAEAALAPEDGDGRFEMFLFGFMWYALPLNPARTRITQATELQEFPTIHFNAKESVEMPFRE
ncbi:hypothetical protein H0H81_009596 [Sphagnurus paluster]|uniref:Uncharacterized protein n=1 Tax=Sphagnurus paluster TaxID=117069 RepID=A0A9P7FVQ5_9AGAR|nr:hypothetical protein H0H81_009596 [Sphagnurus paluster]